MENDYYDEVYAVGREDELIDKILKFEHALHILKELAKAADEENAMKENSKKEYELKLKVENVIREIKEVLWEQSYFDLLEKLINEENF